MRIAARALSFSEKAYACIMYKGWVDDGDDDDDIVNNLFLMQIDVSE